MASLTYSRRDLRYSRQTALRFSSEGKAVSNDSRAARDTDLSLSKVPVSHAPTILGRCGAIRFPLEMVRDPCKE
jgi:hypothetical protein